MKGKGEAAGGEGRRGTALGGEDEGGRDEHVQSHGRGSATLWWGLAPAASFHLSVVARSPQLPGPDGCEKGGPVKPRLRLHRCSATASEGWQKNNC